MFVYFLELKKILISKRLFINSCVFILHSFFCLFLMVVQLTYCIFLVMLGKFINNNWISVMLLRNHQIVCLMGFQLYPSKTTYKLRIAYTVLQAIFGS